MLPAYLLYLMGRSVLRYTCCVSAASRAWLLAPGGRWAPQAVRARGGGRRHCPPHTQCGPRPHRPVGARRVPTHVSGWVARVSSWRRGRMRQRSDERWECVPDIVDLFRRRKRATRLGVRALHACGARVQRVQNVDVTPAMGFGREVVHHS
ncbi:hypothetical protein B0H10DRAFT_673317 [Mycena sp. CBHHK59/15]|nr:hypothetical protein B0H10DRAFT_673317 [Mycena sp. CBHHK59/15]